MPGDDAELGLASQVQPDAIGVPGQRRFRLLVEAQGGSACLWLEKEQLLQLGVAIKGLMAQLPPPRNPVPREGASPLPVSSRPPRSSLEIRISSLSLGHDRARNLFMLAAEGTETEGDAATGLRFWLDHRMLDAMADEAFRVCAAGRPQCPLCGAPMNPGETHLCLRRNGHNKSTEFE